MEGVLFWYIHENREDIENHRVDENLKEQQKKKNRVVNEQLVHEQEGVGKQKGHQEVESLEEEKQDDKIVKRKDKYGIDDDKEESEYG